MLASCVCSAFAVSITVLVISVHSFCMFNARGGLPVDEKLNFDRKKMQVGFNYVVRKVSLNQKQERLRHICYASGAIFE